ncbi:hypothetical protein C1H46_038148, partial [Malus baccata]
LKFIKSFEPIAQNNVVIEEIDGDEDDQCKLIEERPVVLSQCVTQTVEGSAEYPLSVVVDEVVGDDFVADEGVGDGVVGE